MIKPEADKHASRIAVIKFGGDVVANTPTLRQVLLEVAALVQEGWQFLICHGGNPQANELTNRLQLERQQVGGRRITDAATLQVMKQVLAGECNIDVVAAARACGINAVGISAVSGGTVVAIRRPPKVFSGCGPDPVDFGFVGDITRTDASLLRHLWLGSFTPVLNTLGISETVDPESGVCQVYNINADTVASALAAELNADHLFLITGVPGVLEDRDNPDSRIPVLNQAAAQAAIANDVIQGGMIPKIEEAFRNLAQGIGAIHILGAESGSLLQEARQPGSRGTVLVNDA